MTVGPNWLWSLRIAPTSQTVDHRLKSLWWVCIAESGFEPTGTELQAQVQPISSHLEAIAPFNLFPQAHKQGLNSTGPKLALLYYALATHMLQIAINFQAFSCLWCLRVQSCVSAYICMCYSYFFMLYTQHLRQQFQMQGKSLVYTNAVAWFV